MQIAVNILITCKGREKEERVSQLSCKCLALTNKINLGIIMQNVLNDILIYLEMKWRMSQGSVMHNKTILSKLSKLLTFPRPFMRNEESHPARDASALQNIADLEWTFDKLPIMTVIRTVAMR